MQLPISTDFILLFPQFFVSVGLLSGLTLFASYGSFSRSSGKLLVTQVFYFFSFNFFLFFLLLFPVYSFSATVFFSTLYLSPFLNFYTLLVVFTTFFIFSGYILYTTVSDLSFYELPFFLVVVSLATILLIHSNDLLTAYLCLELQALSLYVLSASRLNSSYSTEAGLKYFVLGSFASCLLLLGIALVYTLTGLLNFSDLSFFLNNLNDFTYFNQAIVLGLLLILVALLFKAGVAPFHFWLPDVYAGTAVVNTLFFSIVPKVGAWVMLIKFLVFSSTLSLPFFSEFLSTLVFISLLVGAYGAVFQQSLKRLFAYSAVGHAGYLLSSVLVFSTSGLGSNLVYLFVYSISLFPIFSTLVAYFPRKLSPTPIDSIFSLNYLYKFNPTLAIIFSFSVFSLAGIPPFSGFFSKLYVFFSMVSAGYINLAIIALFLSSASAVYYLRVVRFSLFFKNSRNFIFFYDLNRSMAYSISLFFILNVTFLFWGADLVNTVVNFSSNLFV